MKRKIPDVLTPDEEMDLLAVRSGQVRVQRRNRLMVRLMLNAGLRTKEIVTLQWGDIDLASGKLRVKGKGGRERVLWLGQEDLDLLKDYASSNGSKPSKERIFSTASGKPLLTRYLRQMMERLSKRAGIRHINPHLLRHSFATDLLRQSKNIRLVQKALGHRRITTTEIYTHIVDEELEEAMKNLRN